jgi:hypothetical protein
VGRVQATPGGKKICFALSKPTSVNRNLPGAPASAAPRLNAASEKVKNEVSAIVGYPQKAAMTLPPPRFFDLRHVYPE